MFQKLLLLNPNDNQGVRTLAEEALFKLDRLEDALKIAEQYPTDIMPDTLYGRALALFKLGRREEATVALQQAVENLPLVGKELLKIRHHLPRTQSQIGLQWEVLMRLIITGNNGDASGKKTLKRWNG